MSAAKQVRPARASGSRMSIGAVLELLHRDFADLSVSKIRYLETEGLISPERSASGYRRFSGEDIERLRFILTAQRDHYLPLKVIREQLEALDAGEQEHGATITLPRRLSAIPAPGKPEDFGRPADKRLTFSQLCEQADVSARFGEQVVEARLVRPDKRGFFPWIAVDIVRVAHQLESSGVGIGHLRAFRAAAAREAGIVSQLAQAGQSRAKPGSAAATADKAQELSAAMVGLHALLLKAYLWEEIGS